MWCATRANRWIVVVANMVAFGLWHVAGAFKGDGLEVLDVLGPALLTVLLLWARLRFRSVVAPAVGHASTNVFGLPR